MTLDELISIAEQIRPLMERLMKIEVAPWIRDYVVNMEDLYTELVLEKLDYKPSGEHKIVFSDYKELIVKKVRESSRSNSLCIEGVSAAKQLRLNDHKILMKGDPGMGKTTLCKKIAWDWTRGLLTGYHVVFFVYVKFVKPQDVIENIILKQNPFIAGLNLNERKIDMILRTFGSRCLLILDGLDEHALGTNTDVVKIIRGEKCLDCNIIVTSCPHSTREVEGYFSVTAKVEGFTESKAEQFASKILGDGHKDKITAVLKFNPIDFSKDEPIYKCPILLSFMCLLVREDDIDLSNTTMHIGEVYTRMVRCLYKKYLIRKEEQLHFDIDKFETTVAKIGKLALKTLLSGDPLLQRSVVIKEVGPDAFDYGLLIGHEDAHRLPRDETADIFVTFPHPSVQEFLGALFFIWVLNRGEEEIESLLNVNCDKPMFLTNPLFLRFCLWFLSDDQNYFSFENRHNVYRYLMHYSVKLLNFPVFNMNTVPAFASNDLVLEKLRVKFLADILLNCTKTSKLVLPSSEALDSIFGSIHPVLKAITSIKIGKGTYNIHCYKGTEMVLKSKHGTSDDIDVLLNHYTRLMNQPAVYLYLEATKYVKKKILYPHVKTLHLSCVTGQEIIEKKTKLNPNLTYMCFERIENKAIIKREIKQLTSAAEADNLSNLCYLSLKKCKHLQEKLSVLFKSDWPHLQFLDLFKTDISKKDLEFLCQACNGPEKTIPNLITLRLTIPDDMTTDTFCARLFALQWLKLKSLYLHGLFDSCTCFGNVVIENKLPNLTYFGVQAKARQMDITLLHLNKLATLRSLYLSNCIIHDDLEIASSLSTLNLHDISKENLSLLFITNLSQLTSLILHGLFLEPAVLAILAQSKVKGNLPLVKHLKISSTCTSSLSELKCLFDGPCYWSELLSLDIRDAFKYGEDDKVIDCMNELIDRGYLSSLQKLGIDSFENRNVHWKSLEKLMLSECKDDALCNIVDTACWGYLPKLRTLCIQNFEGHDADIVRTLSQLGVSCHKTYVFQDELFNHDKCLCEM